MLAIVADADRASMKPGVAQAGYEASSSFERMLP